MIYSRFNVHYCGKQRVAGLWAHLYMVHDTKDDRYLSGGTNERHARAVVARLNAREEKRALRSATVPQAR